MTKPVLLMLAAVGSFGSQAAAQEKWAVLLDGLAAKDASVRERAKLGLSVLDGGDWVAKVLDLSMQRRPEVQKLLALALGANSKLLPDLARALVKPGPGLRMLRDALEQHYRAQSLPAPQFPDSVLVFPDQVLRLESKISYLDLHDRLLVAKMFELPLLIDPSLDQKGAWGRKLIALPEGSWLLSEMLPRVAGIGPRTSVDKHGVLLSSWNGPDGFAEFFPWNLSIFLRGHPLPQVAGRAAINLGCMELPTLLPWLDELARGEGALAQRAVLARSVALLRGHEPADVAAFASLLMKSYAKPSAFDYLLGSTLRLLLSRELLVGKLPAWFQLPSQARSHVDSPAAPLWQQKKFATLFATLAPSQLQTSFEELVLGEAVEGEVLLALLQSIRRGRGPLSRKLEVAVLKAVVRRKGAAAPGSDSKLRLSLLHARLALLHERGTRWLPSSLSDVQETSSFDEAQIWGRALRREGKPGYLLILQSLAAARELGTFQLGLLATLLPGGPRPRSSAALALSAKLWFAEEARLSTKASETGRLLLDLVRAWMGPKPPVTRESWAAFYSCWDRILAVAVKRIEKGEPANAGREVDLLLGRALGRLLVVLPRSPGNRSVAAWLGGWLAKKDWADLAMAAAVVCLPERRSLEYSIPLSSARRPSALEAVILRQRLSVLARTRPLRMGWAPVDLEDPLLALQAVVR